jgi:hypothetical protein
MNTPSEKTLALAAAIARFAEWADAEACNDTNGKEENDDADKP